MSQKLFSMSDDLYLTDYMVCFLWEWLLGKGLSTDLYDNKWNSHASALKNPHQFSSDMDIDMDSSFIIQHSSLKTKS